MIARILKDIDTNTGQHYEAWQEAICATTKKIYESNSPVSLAMTNADVANLYLGTAYLIATGLILAYMKVRWKKNNVIIPITLLIYFLSGSLTYFLALIPSNNSAYKVTQLTYGFRSQLAFGISLIGIFVLHRHLKRPGHAELFNTNTRLTSEVKNSIAAEKQISKIKNELEARVIERTLELEKANYALTTEIDEGKASALALKKAKDRAEASNRSKNEFLANMSHEIRTPMTAIVGFTDMLTNEQNTLSERFSYIESIRRNSDSLLKIIDDILDLAKSEFRVLDVDKSSVYIREIVNEMRIMFASMAEEKGLNLTFTANNSLPEFIVSDPVRIRQILINLIGNALKFTGTGKISVGISYANQKIYFQVTDSGCGINPAYSQKLFQPFVQADSSITRRYGGTGLGLALSRRLANSLDGDIILTDSVVGVGSSFEFHCSTGDVSGFSKIKTLDAKSILNSSLNSNSSEKMDLTGIQILLVEDSLDLQLLTSRILTDRGANITIAHNGKEGLEKATSFDYDLVLMDIQMPEMDGLTAAIKLRQIGYSTPMIAMTAYAIEGDREKCLAAGFTDYISKPIKRDSLIQLIWEYTKKVTNLESTRTKLITEKENDIDMDLTVSETVSEFANDPVIGPILNIFVDSLPDRLAKLKKALDTENLDEVKKISHQLRGSAGAFGFSQITLLSGLLEDAVASQKDWQEALGFAEKLFAAASKIRLSAPVTSTSPTDLKENAPW